MTTCQKILTKDGNMSFGIYKGKEIQGILIKMCKTPAHDGDSVVLENEQPGERSHPSAGPQVGRGLPGAQLPLPGLWNSPVRSPRRLQVLLLPGPQVG